MRGTQVFQMEQRNGQRLILFPLPYQGHINSMLELANLLYSKGFSITIIHTSFNSLDPSSHPHFTYHSIHEGFSKTTKDPLLVISSLNAKCHEPFRDCLTRLLSSDRSEKEPVACLIADSVYDFTQSVAESLKLPMILLRAMSASSFAIYATFPLLRDKGYLPKKETRLEEVISELSPFKIKDLPLINSNGPDRYFKIISDLKDQTKASQGLILNTFEELDQRALASIRHNYSIPIFPLGPFHKGHPNSSSTSSSLFSQDASCISWLNTQAPNSVVYVSFGSVSSIPEAQFVEIAYGLANGKHPFLWVVRPGLVSGSDWLEVLPHGFLENLNGKGHIVKWASQKEVLSHQAVGLFWTHCGWNSTLESICEGVPMICMPCSADQMMNARYVSDVWKVGLHLENRVERGNIERTIGRLMLEEERERVKERAVELKKMAKACVEPSGSSYQSLDALTKYILSFN